MSQRQRKTHIFSVIVPEKLSDLETLHMPTVSQASFTNARLL